MKKVVIILLLAVSGLFISCKTAQAASLSLSPTSQSINQNETFTTNITLNTGTTAVNGCDVILTFNPQIIKVDNVTFGDTPLFSSSNVSTPDNTNGKLTLNSSVSSSAFAFKGSGTLATVNFKAIGTGSAAVAFTCTANNKIDTNIWDSQSQDIVNCAVNIGAVYTITSSSLASSETLTPTPTTVATGVGSGIETSELTSTPTSSLLEAGDPLTTNYFIMIGLLLLITGVSYQFVFRRN